jgi:hypothetical protein
MMAKLIALAFMLVAFAAAAAEVAGVQLPDKTQVESRELVLNGAGLRKRLFFNVYVIGLYLAEKKGDPNAVLQLTGPKRAVIHMLRDVDAEDFTEAMIDGMRPNLSEAEFKSLGPRLKMLTDTIAEIKEAKKGMSIALDWTGSATRVAINGQTKGKPIEGEDFYRALLRIWLGDKPVQDDLKRALLGA